MPTIETNGVATHYERRGDGPPVVFVHAAMLDHSQWNRQVDALAGEFDCITYDVRGHGHTGGSSLRSYSIDLFADDLAALLDALDVERPVLCGHSTGGCVAQVYAANYPDRVAGVVLADTFAPEIRGRGEWLQRSLFLRLSTYPVRLLGYQRVERALVWLHERLHGERVSGDYDSIRALRADGPTMTTAEFAKVARAVASFHETAVDLSAITAPTLVLYGAYAPAFQRAHAATFAATIPRVEVREVPGAGHASNLDNASFFTDAVREFASRVQ
ncbi:alpha/beta fold hydrolase [Halobacterium zhouii]|uniref:alpha/beta fold hydrolase n=1 Tax=Halobacterium zhouii TaxID=2902624 RepID=UPI001E3DBCB1|nr:alpha/beta hydrolase [Halobacterium zhouii]